MSEPDRQHSTNARPIAVLAEPDPGASEVASTYLSEFGFNVVAIPRIRAAIAACFGRRRPGILVMQCHAPLTHALQACESLRRFEIDTGSNVLPILGMSSDHSEAVESAFRAVGVTKILAVPFSPEAFGAAVAYCFELGHTR